MVSISLKAKGKAPLGTAPALRAPVAFADIEDESVDAAPTAGASSRAAVNKRLSALNAGNTKVQRKRIEQELKVDRTVYEYDEVWDRMQDAKQKAKEAKEVEQKDRQPKYIKNLLVSAETRRLDYLRAEEKMIQRERDAEGDEFADKEQFVTQAYKDQMAAVRKAEAEEKMREAAMKTNKLTTGMTHFYRQLLEQSEEIHSATIAATENRPTPGPSLNLTISRPPSYTPASDKDLAAQARSEGKEVELNDDNQIVDRRELLSAGLNLAAPNTRRLGGLQSTRRKVGPAPEDVQVHRAVGTAATREEINERRIQEVKKQMAEEDKHTRMEKARKEEEERARIVAKRNTEEEIQNARDRYLQRKRRKLEEDSGDD